MEATCVAANCPTLSLVMVPDPGFGCIGDDMCDLALTGDGAGIARVLPGPSANHPQEAR